ncbi:single-stranded DNA-binding protein [Arachidicoccus sp.]|jgi:single-strand DNA-binding protein|uniref:single-stranded DNA-binding protein n=1 Tax=Arachidicoccus sp. TaxID=1872624 RepID=UPI003D1A1725
MSNVRNQVQLIGHLGANPEIKIVNGGNKVVRLRIATNESYKTSAGEWKVSTQWHNIGLWDHLADKAQAQMRKGSYVMIDGKLINRAYTDSNGQKKYLTEVRAHNILLLDKKTDNNNNDQQLPEPNAQEGDCPF